MYQIRLAKLADVKALVKLEKQNAYDELGDNHGNSLNADVFTEKELTELVKSHWLVVAFKKTEIIGYMIAAKWSFFKGIPIYSKMLRKLSEQGISDKNSCQYGPVWVDKRYRGKGVFVALFDFLLQTIKHQFAFMVTFISEKNELSFAAHTKKAKMEIIDYFDFEGRDYYLLKKGL